MFNQWKGFISIVLETIRQCRWFVALIAVLLFGMGGLSLCGITPNQDVNDIIGRVTKAYPETQLWDANVVYMRGEGERVKKLRFVGIGKYNHKLQEYKVRLKITHPLTLAGIEYLILISRNLDAHVKEPDDPKIYRIGSVVGDQPIAGTSITFEDLRPESLSNFVYELLSQDKIVYFNNDKCWLIESTPKPTLKTTYSKKRFFVDYDAPFIYRIEFYKDNKIIKTIDRSERLHDEKIVLTRVKVVDIAGGSTTTIDFNIWINMGLPELLFTKASLGIPFNLEKFKKEGIEVK